MSFIKITHIHTSKLIKIDADWTYDDLVAHTRNKFPEVSEREFVFTDGEGTIIESDVLLDFIQTASKPPNFMTLYVASLHDTPTNDSSPSTISIFSVANDGYSLLIDSPASPSISNSDSAESAKLDTTAKSGFNKHISVQEWQQYITEHGGQEFIESYSVNGMLSPKSRRQLVNTCCSQLVKLYGLKVPEFAKIDLAKAITSIFPKLRDPHSPHGYEAFYKNDNGGEGYIAWRLRTIARNSNSDVIRKRKSRKSVTEEGSAKKIKTATNEDTEITDDNTESPLTKQVEDDIEYLKNASPIEDLEMILHKTCTTFTYRRTLKEDFLTKFPRFLDTPALIEQEFEAIVNLQQKVNFEDLIRNDADRILNIYHIQFSNKNKNVYNDLDDSGNPNFDKTTRALLALAVLLPTLRKKIDLETIIIYKHANTPISEIKPKTTQPVLLGQGQNKRAISQYNILVDGRILECPRMCSSGKAFEYLFMTHYVFNLKYESTLKCFWEFIQTFYFKIDVEGILYTPTMTEIRANLLNSE